jgi:hypothetical protein
VERDLVVEGLAYDAQQDSFYLSSLNRRKIVVRVDRRDRTVWANSSLEGVSQSELLHFDSLGNLLGRYAIKDSLEHGFNDLVVRDDGRVLQFDPSARTRGWLAG